MKARIREVLLLLLVALLFWHTGCMKLYVDGGLPKVAYGDIEAGRAPQPVQLNFEFQQFGKRKGLATKLNRTRVKKILESSNLFTAVETSDAADLAQLDIVINNTGDTGEAAAKGFTAGLTFGAKGSLVTDHYTMTGTYQAPGGTPVKKVYHHAIHSKIGKAKAPEGLEPVSLTKAIDEVFTGLVLNFLKDLRDEGHLK